ncbi:MAG: type II secretion system F family protein [Armatimonadetes bacterium]|nr:type II secretion system F family protein [Armatimonadota bacterium]
MPTFTYEALDDEGKLVKGTLQGIDQRAVISKLKDKRYTITNIREKREFQFRPQFLSRISQQSLTIFSRQLATMVHAGLALTRCIDVCMNQGDDRKLAEVLRQVKEDISGGVSLSNALAKHGNVFSPLYVSLIKAGELSGEMSEILERLATFLEKDFALAQKVKSAMAYPLVIFGVCIVLVFLLVTFIFPNFVALFEGLNVKLPLSTKLLILMTNTVRNPIYLIPAISLIGVLGFLLAQYVKTPVGKRQFHALLLRVPIFGPISKKVAVARFCRTFGTLFASGVPIMHALEIVGQSSGNEVINETSELMRSSLRGGSHLSQPMQESRVFPPLVVGMVTVGEQTGNLHIMLHKISDFYETEVDYALSGLTSLIEPIMIAGMGLIVAFVVISVFMPVYQLLGTFSG